MNLYQNANYQPPISVNPGVPPFVLLGCYTDDPNSRALPKSLVDWNAMTVQKCLQAAVGRRYAAVEYYGKASKDLVSCIDAAWKLNFG
jgi:hypothetical protein